jgi:phage terminase small subunit
MTPKQEKFAQCIADGMNQADAYRAAYDAEKMKPESIYSKASELMADGKVSSRVQELKKQLSSKALWTRADSVRALETAMRIAQDKDNAAGLVAAVKELNAMHGFNEPSKLELTGGTNNVNRVEFLLVNT